eukprot:CAMPEP_0194543664 /NCGR_PEP_ID=MMETSP0253-20130528/86193_1 /TAXON_ID=2966 /ORGANISM="Noctiluca scintillans" /LENGTH=128 /DNA_ID=CAMNT_0039390451 /DNA_START=114 /DNA_END=501 /DNA_ORIENTATION=-
MHGNNCGSRSNATHVRDGSHVACKILVDTPSSSPCCANPSSHVVYLRSLREEDEAAHSTELFELRWSGRLLWQVEHPSALIVCLQLSRSSLLHIWSVACILEDESHMIVPPLGNDTEVFFLCQGSRKL